MFDCGRAKTVSNALSIASLALRIRQMRRGRGGEDAFACCSRSTWVSLSGPLMQASL